MFKIAAFADEIDSDIEEQARILLKEGIYHLELRVWGDRTLVELSRDELRRIKQVIKRNEFIVSDIASPIGKVLITDDFEEHLNLFKKYIEMAKVFETKMIRIFSYYCPQDQPPEEFSDEVIERMRRKTEIAADNGITLLMENERWLYGNIGSRCWEILETIGSPFLRMAFDPQNFLAEGERPFPDNYKMLADYIAHVHIKDGKLNEPDTFLYAGDGDGEIKGLLLALKRGEYKGFLSLEPHLGIFGESDKETRIKLFHNAHEALRKILREIKAEVAT
jgi:sugar phosphate isomerase/epimerase